jgi:hypothetical protein
VQNWLKTQPKNFFPTELKQNLWNAGSRALKSREITMKSNVSFVSVYLQ